MTNKVLVAYCSHSGNTRIAAQQIAKATGGELWEIVPEEPYPVSYSAVVEQAKKEIRAGHRPALREDRDVSGYNTVFVGTPNWWSTVAPPIASFLAGHDLVRKHIIPFLTHGGGGEARIPSDIRKLCPGAEVLPYLAIYGNDVQYAQKRIIAWLQGIGF